MRLRTATFKGIHDVCRLRGRTRNHLEGTCDILKKGSPRLLPEYDRSAIHTPSDSVLLRAHTLPETVLCAAAACCVPFFLPQGVSLQYRSVPDTHPCQPHHPQDPCPGSLLPEMHPSSCPGPNPWPHQPRSLSRRNLRPAPLPHLHPAPHPTGALRPANTYLLWRRCHQQGSQALSRQNPCTLKTALNR